MYNKVDTNLNFIDREDAVARFWRENNIFEKSIAMREGRENFTFYDGPPTANGKPHIGHVLTRVIKDMIPRYRTMKGYRVLRKAGWDTHGLPVELEVEKLLGLDGKEQIEEYGLEPFIKHCKESVWKYKGMWEDFSDKVGYWADMNDPYVTYSDDYIESVWWSLKKIYDRGLLYKGFKIVPYCPRCGTPLSSHEVAQGYKDVKEKSAFVKFRARGEENTFYLAWTTTPWTLPSNIALCVNAEETYVKVKAGDECYILAQALVPDVVGDCEILESYTGAELEYREYEPLFDFVKTDKRAFYITCAEYVTLSDGTGIVHIAPAFGEDDSRVGSKYRLPFVQLVDAKGQMTEETPWAGVFCKNADREIVIYLKTRNLLYKTMPYEHSYPFCWRCDTPLIYYARSTWFIKMTEVRQQLLDNNDTINWIPENVGKGRFGEWLKNVQDWGISRDRYWGTPLNIWECECGHTASVGSREELKRLCGDCADGVELHRPYIDAVTFKCEKCGGVMHRVKQVIDCWYDSGAMPFAQYHYPFENEDLFNQTFPADFISEAVDQTRGWFYSLLAISTLIFNKAPYKNVIVLGHVQDENGQKMSKTKGNAVDPFDALSRHGADAIRWYFYSNSAPWLPNRFLDSAVRECQSKFMGTLWNTYAFFVLYANIDHFDATSHSLEYEKLSVMDKWILSKLNTLNATVDSYLSDYRITETAREMESFTDNLSNWYVRRCRERFWAKELTQDKINAYMTLYTCLVTFVKLASPLIPFMTEDIYRNLVCTNDKAAPESVHLCDYPVSNPDFIDTELEAFMDEAVDIVVLGRACRNAAVIKNRQPLACMYINAPEKLSEYYTGIIKDELNVKKAVFVDDLSRFTTFSFKPQLRTLGKKLGKQINELRVYLSGVNGREAMKEIEKTGKLKVALSDGEHEIEREDLLIEAAKADGFESVSDNGVTVVLDIELSEELIEEGNVREVISKLQTMRKDAGFEVMDRITVYMTGSGVVRGVIERNREKICHDTLTDEVMFCEPEGYIKDWNINGEDAVFGVKRN